MEAHHYERVIKVHLNVYHEGIIYLEGTVMKDRDLTAQEKELKKKLKLKKNFRERQLRDMDIDPPRRCVQNVKQIAHRLEVVLSNEYNSDS